MIILVEQDKEIRKSLADLLSRERLIGVDSIQESLQMILKFKNDLDLIVANVVLLSELLSKHIIERVCQRLSIDVPPIVGIYKEDDEEAKHRFMAEHKGYRIIRYGENDLGFPNRYLEAIQKACPELVIDYEKAREAWLKKQQPQELVDPRKWLEEEVVYIITSKEKDVFLQLESDKEREFLIEAFWKQRDPTPGTPENEFKEEHYRRINYANQWFGRGTSLSGWKTDRGKIYIILGKPVSMETYGEDIPVVPIKVWFYQKDPSSGLPGSFYIAFFQEGVSTSRLPTLRVLPGTVITLTAVTSTPNAFSTACLI